MKRPVDQAKLLLFALLRSTATAIATGDKGRAVLPHTGSIQLRVATRVDVPSIHRCNLACLPENYNPNFYNFHIRQWPDFSLVAEHVSADDENPGIGFEDGLLSIDEQSDRRGRFHRKRESQKDPLVVGYLLGKIEKRPYEDYRGIPRVETLGHVTSLAVLKDYRRLGLARALMTQLHYHLLEQGLQSCALHVRTSNQAACRLYRDDGYEIVRVIPRYYQDGEDAYYMKKKLGQESFEASAEATRKSGLFRKAWKSGRDEFRLPRIHSLPNGNVGLGEGPNSPVAEAVLSSSAPSPVESEPLPPPEVLTGSV